MQLSGYHVAWHNKSKHLNSLLDAGHQANAVEYGIDNDRTSQSLDINEVPDKHVDNSITLPYQ